MTAFFHHFRWPILVKESSSANTAH